MTFLVKFPDHEKNKSVHKTHNISHLHYHGPVYFWLRQQQLTMKVQRRRSPHAGITKSTDKNEFVI